MDNDTVTSIRIDKDLWKKAKIHAIQNEITMKELIESLIRDELTLKRENRRYKNGT